MTTENTVVTVRDLEGARELGRLSGEVRVLKWSAAIVAPMLFAYLTFLSLQINDVRNDLTQQINSVRSDLTQQINGVRSDLTEQINEVRSDLTTEINKVRSDLTGQIDVMQEGQTAIRERITVVEQTLVAGSL